MIESLDSMFRSILFWIIILLISFYVYLKKAVFSYWQVHGIPHDDFAIPFGIFGRDFFMKKTNIGNVVRKSYEKLRKYPYHGVYIFLNRFLMINDPELIKQILVKDFASFCDRGLYSKCEIDPLVENLVFLNGNTWKTSRVKLSPTFTSRKLKYMFPIFNNIAIEMIKVAEKDLRKTDVLEIKDLIARYTTDTIFSFAFGFESQSLRYPDSECRYYGNLAVDNTLLHNALGFLAPKILYALRQPFFDSRVEKFFVKLFQNMVDKRRAEGIKREDFLDSLIELMDREEIIDKETDNSNEAISADKIAKKLELLEAVAQAFIFFLAGFENSSSVTTHCLYELALNSDVQEKVQQEIDELLDNSKALNYESIMQLEYLDMVFYEAMRKHPALPFLVRNCINDYKLPNSEFTIPSGMSIIISVSGLHMNPDIYPEPKKFDPLRFSKENTASRHPYTYLAFGEGPRICIGKRLGLLQSKIALFHLLANYKFSACEKTPIPNHYTPSSITQSPRDSIHLKVEKRKVT